MKYSIFIICLLFNYNISAQDSTEVKVYNSILQVGEFASFGDRSLKFKKVVSDSRCPTGVTCIWAGEAKILVEIYENNKFLKEKVITVGGGEIPLDLLAEGIRYNINKLVLSPYPSIETQGKEIKYSLYLQVNELLNPS